MKHSFLSIIFITLLFSSCKDENKSEELENKATYVTCLGDGTEEVAEDEIHLLIINVLVWSHSNSINLTPPEIVENDTVFKSFDTEQLSKNLVILEKTGFFTYGFMANYENIIETLDKKLKNGDFGVWSGGEYPPFSFDSDVDPWCMCQDNFAWDEVETEVIQLDDKKGELYWRFGGIKPENDPNWKDFKYKFKVAKENGKWKIDWMEGFDYETSTKSDGL